jgi:hypothetical protein
MAQILRMLGQIRQLLDGFHAASEDADTKIQARGSERLGRELEPGAAIPTKKDVLHQIHGEAVCRHNYYIQNTDRRRRLLIMLLALRAHPQEGVWSCQTPNE